MLVIGTPEGSPLGDGPQAQRRVETSIKATSPFSPKSWICSQCHETNSPDERQCTRQGCDQELDRNVTILDQKGRTVTPARFPVSWVCSTCYLIHLILEIITGEAACTCGQPTLQAIYDQFGDLFLFWRDDPTIHDLNDPTTAEEAARRLWVAGGDRWLEEMPRIMLEEEEKKPAEEMEMEMPML
jgi:hypothetical protein